MSLGCFFADWPVTSVVNRERSMRDNWSDAEKETFRKLVGSLDRERSRRRWSTARLATRWRVLLSQCLRGVRADDITSTHRGGHRRCHNQSIKLSRALNIAIAAMILD